MNELNIWSVMSFMTILFMSFGGVTHGGKLGVLPASYVELFCFSFTPSLQLCLLLTNGLLLHRVARSARYYCAGYFVWNFDHLIFSWSHKILGYFIVVSLIYNI